MREQRVQIQTVNSCNANCIKCPNTKIYQTRKVMEDDVFLKILYELKTTFPNTFFHFDVYLQNEPLLDPKLFDRIKLIKSYFKGHHEIYMSSNAMLLPKYQEKIMEVFEPEIDHLNIALHTWDAESYNMTHGTKISQEKFDKMKKSCDELSEHFKEKGHYNLFTEKITDDKELYESADWYQLAYSRAGFLSKNRILIKELEGCMRDKHKYFNFLYDGSLILCCMDYLRQTVYGNIKHQTLQEIIDSSIYKTLMNKVEGEESADDFICKKCELGAGTAADTYQKFALDGEDIKPLLDGELN